MTSRFKVSGMHCAHCQNAVKTGVEKLSGVKSADVDLKKGLLTVEHEPDADFEGKVRTCVSELGFSAEPCGEEASRGFFGAIRSLLKKQ